MEAETASMRASAHHTGKKRPMTLVANNDTPTNDDRQCPICLESINDKNVALTCAHVFHDHCINEWIKTSADEQKLSKCPVCRSKVQVQIVIE